MTRRQKKRSFQRIIFTILLVPATILIANYLRTSTSIFAETHTAAATTPIESLLNAEWAPQLSNTPSQIVHYSGYTASFNSKLHIPNWVAWELTDEETRGTVPRADKFYTDESVAGCPDTYDYNYSGYDRGHMCPAGDMKWSEQSMKASFSLVNICPQAKALNTGAWKKLEEKCRKWAQADSAIIIICGPIITDRLREAIGDNRVAVPKRFFKVILSPYAKPARAIGFIMNNGKVDGGMQQAAVSVDQVEAATSLNFFAALPDSIENTIEAQCDFPYWSTLRPKK